MSHVLHVTCHKCYMSQILSFKILPNTLCVIYFWKALSKSSSIVMQKMSHVTCITGHMSQMLHVTNIKLPRILPKTPCVIYFWKAVTKSSSMVIKKMSHVTKLPKYYKKPCAIYFWKAVRNSSSMVM